MPNDYGGNSALRKRRIAGVVRACLVASALLISAVAQNAPSGKRLMPGPTKALAAAGPANVLLITLDTVRYDRVGCYGAHANRVPSFTPALDSLCYDGIAYTRAFSQVPLTWPSHAAILTGTYPFQNGVQDFTGPPMLPKFRNVAEAFRAHGYATGAVVSSFVLDRSWGLSRGFDAYDDAFAGNKFLNRDIALVDRRAEESVDHALTWLRGAKRPFFFWLHLYDPHSPYDPPEPYKTDFADDLYDGEIAYADSQIGRVFDWLKKSGLYDHTAIVFVSDHGESLGEHGESEHGFFLYHATTHIPLIVKPAKAANATKAGVAAKTEEDNAEARPANAKRASDPVETIAIAPTLLSLAGISDAISAQLSGKVLPGVGGQPLFGNSELAAYSETFYPFSSFGWSPLHALEQGRYRLIDAPVPELYDVVEDPNEAHNLAEDKAAIVSVMRDKLHALLRQKPFEAQANASNAGVSPEATEKLRALGYVAYRSPVSAQQLANLADPKTKLWEFNSILRAADAFQAKDFATGEDLLREVSQKDSSMYLVSFMLGEAALRQQKWADAAAELKSCLQLNPNFDQAMTALARALQAQSDFVGAREWLRKAIAINPQNYRAWYALASLEAQADGAGPADLATAKAAIEAYQKTLEIQPNFGLAQRDLGMLYFRQRDYADALPHLERAIASGLAEAKLHNFLGICYSRANRLAEAVASYREALRLEPKLAEGHANLGFALERLGKAAEAQAEYTNACGLDAKLCRGK